MRCKSLALLAAVGTRLASSFSVQGLDFPTKLAYHAPSGTLFIAQKAGVVNAIRANSTSNVSAPVLDISAGEWRPWVDAAHAAAGGGGGGVEQAGRCLAVTAPPVVSPWVRRGRAALAAD